MSWHEDVHAMTQYLTTIIVISCLLPDRLPPQYHNRNTNVLQTLLCLCLLATTALASGGQLAHIRRHQFRNVKISRPVLSRLIPDACNVSRSGMEPTKIADSEVTHAVTKEKTTFRDLWKDQTCVIIFLRRFGWPYCRLAAKEISGILPQLKQHNVRYI